MTKSENSTHFLDMSCQERYEHFKTHGGSLREALWFLSELGLKHQSNHLGTCCVIAARHLLRKGYEVKHVFPRLWAYSYRFAGECHLSLVVVTRTESYDLEVNGKGEEVSYSRSVPQTTKTETVSKYFTLTLEFD